MSSVHKAFKKTLYLALLLNLTPNVCNVWFRTDQLVYICKLVHTIRIFYANFRIIRHHLSRSTIKLMTFMTKKNPVPETGFITYTLV